MNLPAVTRTNCDSLKLINRGKVRDVYEVGDNLLIVSTDRISAFDVILPDPVPMKGVVLNQLSVFWMKKMADICPNHLVETNVNRFPNECAPYAATLAGRSVIARKAQVFVVECVARGYIIGSGWKDYKRTGAVCGIALPPGLREAEKLSEPLFTPSTKAELGSHDENISFKETVNLIGEESAKWLRDKTLELYAFGARWAKERGVIIADTKFEFGVIDDVPTLVDEALTPDSSRFWPVDQYQVGMSPPSLDKQFVRDYLETLDWDKTDPGPSLPEHVLLQTADKYKQIYRILTEREISHVAG